jgi:hypothetical protein
MRNGRLKFSEAVCYDVYFSASLAQTLCYRKGQCSLPYLAMTLQQRSKGKRRRIIRKFRGIKNGNFTILAIVTSEYLFCLCNSTRKSECGTPTVATSTTNRHHCYITALLYYPLTHCRVICKSDSENYTVRVDVLTATTMKRDVALCSLTCKMNTSKFVRT